MGKYVGDTVRKGITSYKEFEDNPPVLMLGMSCSLVAAAVWLLIATYLSWPVSTTHSIVGAIIGFAIAARGWGAVDWYKVQMIVLSWFASPFLSMVFGFFGFYIIRTLVVRPDMKPFGAETPKKSEEEEEANPTPTICIPHIKAYIAYPISLFIMCMTASLYIVYKGSPRTDLKKTELWTAVGWSMLISAGMVAVLAPGCMAFACYQVKGLEKEEENVDIEMEGDLAAKAESADGKTAGLVDADATQVKKLDPAEGDGSAVEEEEKSTMDKVLKCLYDESCFADIHGNMDETTKAMHEAQNDNEPKTEEVFKFMQVATASFDSFAHGANDIANAIGPFSAVVGVYLHGTASKKVDIPFWVLLIGVVGLVIGLGTYGVRVIRTIGVKITPVTPSRGFVIEWASAVTVLTAARLGIPVSTTHCQVGAVVGVGLLQCNGAKCLNACQLVQIAASWVLTLVFAACVSALLYATMSAITGIA